MICNLCHTPPWNTRRFLWVSVVASSSLAGILWEYSAIHSLPAIKNFLFEVEISSRTINSTFCARISPQWLSELRWLWPNVPWQVACELISGQFPTLCLDSSIVSPLWLCWVKGVCVCRCNLPPALLAHWPGSVSCRCGNMGWNGHQIWVGTESLLLRRNFCHHSCWDLNLQPLDYESSTEPTSYQIQGVRH